MSILIAYDSLHEPAKKCISILKSEFNRNIDIIKLSEVYAVPEWNKYRIIIIGSCVAYDKMQQTVRDFCQKYEDEIIKKELGVFISCLMSPQKAARIIDHQLPKKIVRHAKVKGCFGGLFQMQDLSILRRLHRRFILRKTEENFTAFLHQAVTSFAKAFDPLQKQYNR